VVGDAHRLGAADGQSPPGTVELGAGGRAGDQRLVRRIRGIRRNEDDGGRGQKETFVVAGNDERVGDEEQGEQRGKGGDEVRRTRRREVGEDFGAPYCYQGTLPDPEFGWGRKCSEFTKPVTLLGPHTAALDSGAAAIERLPP